MSKISLVIPVYNGEKDIECCLKSILRQTFEDLEVIVVNDGSTDKTLSICQHFEKSDKRVKVISKRNAGRMMARLTGYQATNGEYIGFVDHDDYLPRHAIKTMFSIIEKYHVDCVIGGASLVYGNFPVIKKKLPNSPILEKVISGDTKWSECFGLCFEFGDRIDGAMWGKLFRKECVDRAFKEHPETLFPKALLEDWWFTLILLPYLNSLYTTNEVVYYYRVGGTSWRDYPCLEESNGYFNYRYHFFEKNEGNNDLIKRTYVCFLRVFYKEVLQKVYSKSYSDEQISSFITDQLNSQDIVEWAIGHPQEIPSEVSIISDFVVSKDADGLVQLAKNNICRSAKKDRRRKILIPCYSAACRIFEFLQLDRIFWKLYKQ